jgi:hypothetical protein
MRRSAGPRDHRRNGYNDLSVIVARNFRMEALIFFACLVFATFGIIAGLYATCRDTKPDRGAAPHHRVRFLNFR